MKKYLAIALLVVFPACKEFTKDLMNAEELKRQIFPLADTWTWNYQVTTFGSTTFGTACQPGKVTRTTRGSAQLSTRKGTYLPGLCQSGTNKVAYATDGDQVWYWNGAEWDAYIEAPLTDGKKFLSGNQSFTWYSRSNITVPAGTYSDCWTKRHDKTDSYETFCRGVGLVQAYQVDAFGNGWKATLDSAVGPSTAKTRVDSVTTSPQTEDLEN